MGCCGKVEVTSRGGGTSPRTADIMKHTPINTAKERGFRGLTAREAAYGAVQIAKVEVGINVVGREEATRRIKICAICPEKFEDGLGPVSWWGCRKCNCILRFKTMSGNQSCPIDKW
jgi:hypothetical protein